MPTIAVAALTHNPFGELQQTATDRLFQLMADMSKRAKRLGGEGFRLDVENRGTSFAIKLKAKEGRDTELTDTGCYVSATIHQQGPRKTIRVLGSVRCIGPFAETANRRAGIEVLHTLGTVLHGATDGFEFTD